jgi:ATP-dependent Clp protease ATP-binding subunit ClpB
MDITRFTEKAQQALGSAQSKAARLNHQQVDVEHLLSALLEEEDGLALSLLSKAEINVEGVKRGVDRELERLPKVSGPSGAPDQIYVTGRLSRLLAKAEDEAKTLKDEYISVEHLLLEMTGDGGSAGIFLK